MSKSRKYYYLVSSLPELHFNDKLPFSVEDFLNEYEDQLRSERENVDMLLLRYDLKNINLIFKDKLSENNIHKPSVYDIEELKDHLKMKEDLPDFVIEFLNKYPEKEERKDNLMELDKEYFLYASESDNYFISEYFRFELAFRNVIASTRAKKYDTDVLKYSVGDDNDDIILSKIKRNKSLPDFGIGSEAVWVGKVVQAFEKEDPLMLEEELDRIRFEQVDNIIAMLDFQSDVIFAFIIKLMILERWNNFDNDYGKDFTESIVEKII